MCLEPIGFPQPGLVHLPRWFTGVWPLLMEPRCRNFAVLVDLHILPQGSRKSPAGFQNRKKGTVLSAGDSLCPQRAYNLMGETNARYRLRITAYFIKREIHLHCIVGKPSYG
ncbi:protein SLX4IP isoform X2 [Phascolarctos cinereus]